MLLVLKDVENAIKSGQFDLANKHFTDYGLDCYNSLIVRGKPSIVTKPDYHFLKLDTIVHCRSLKMQFTFEDNFRPIIENVCFRFNSDNKIVSLSFMIAESVEKDIFSDEIQWSDTAKMVLVSFLEDYKTAYALKRIEYLNKIFSNDALIISGVILKTKKLTEKDEIRFENISKGNNDNVVYKTLSKKEYIEKLESNFNMKKWVNIMFEDISIKRRLTSDFDLYGIQLKQNYFSDSYCDEGYLSLLVDLKNEFPMIYVCVWQVEKDSNFTAKTIVDFPGKVLKMK